MRRASSIDPVFNHSQQARHDSSPILRDESLEVGMLERGAVFRSACHRLQPDRDDALCYLGTAYGIVTGRHHRQVVRQTQDVR